MFHPWHDLPAGDDAPETIQVVIEIPKGSRNKYELDKQTGLYHLSRVLYSPMIYPGDYGFIPQSYYEDGDPLDILVLTNEPTFTGCVVNVRPVGIFKMLDKGEPDDKILCVATHSPYFGHIHELSDVPPHFLREVAHFFAVYKDLEGSRTLALGWDSATEAKRRVVHALDLYKREFQRKPKPVKPLLDESAEDAEAAPAKSAVKKSAAAKPKAAKAPKAK